MKKGSTLVESIVSLFILFIVVAILNSITLLTIKSIKYRKEKDEVDRVIYAIENEIKYNITFKELDVILVNGEISYKYSENIINTLTSTSLKSLETGNGDRIVIKKEKDNNDESFKIYQYNIRIYKRGVVIIERNVIKSYWM